MGMVGCYRRISADQLEALLRNPETVEELVFSEEEDGTVIEIDKSWHGIHFLLNGAPWSGEGPLFNVVLGGRELGEVEVGYGPARYLTPAEVQETNAALATVSDGELRARYNPEAFRTADIYVVNGSNPEDLDYMMQYLSEVRQIFGQAAANGEAMLLYTI